MRYQKELDFIVFEMKKAYHMFSAEAMDVSQKAKHDLVTNIDESIEKYLAKAIKTTFVDDRILGEEMSSNTVINGRTWTIDPIDGTCNMASDIGLYGVQCSLMENYDIVLAAIYIPSFDYFITAVKGAGCFFNGKKVCAKKDVVVNNAIVSFGDYPHKNSDRLAQWQHTAIKNVFGLISRIRMFGSAAIDFSFVAAGKTDGTVVVTRNLWDIAPGILVCKESGAVVVDLDGNAFSEKSDGVIVGANEEVAGLLVNAFRHRKDINRLNQEKKYDGVIFDFDGVILDTEKYHYLSWVKAFEKYNAPLSAADYENLKSRGRTYIIDYFDSRYHLHLTEEEKCEIALEKHRLYAQYAQSLSEKDFVPHVLEYLAFLKSHYTKIGIASSSEAVKQQLDQFGIAGCFDVVIDGKADLRKKPHPDAFLEAAKLMNVAPENCLVFEDAPVGVEAAMAGGFDVIYVGENPSGKVCSIRDFSAML